MDDLGPVGFVFKFRAVFVVVTPDALLGRDERCSLTRVCGVGGGWPVAVFTTDVDQVDGIFQPPKTSLRAVSGRVATLTRRVYLGAGQFQRFPGV